MYDVLLFSCISLENWQSLSLWIIITLLALDIFFYCLWLFPSPFHWFFFLEVILGEYGFIFLFHLSILNSLSHFLIFVLCCIFSKFLPVFNSKKEICLLYPSAHLNIFSLIFFHFQGIYLTPFKTDTPQIPKNVRSTPTLWKYKIH